MRRCAEEETLEEEEEEGEDERAEKTREQNGAEDNKYAIKPASWSGTARSVSVYMYMYNVFREIALHVIAVSFVCVFV